MKLYPVVLLSSLCLLGACSLEPSRKTYDPDEEFSKLDSPEVSGFYESLERQALEALKNGDNSSASGLYKQLHDSKPDEVRYQLGLAEALRRLGDNEAALLMYEKVVAKQPGNLDAFEGKALALMAKGDTQEAGRLFKLIKDRDASRWRTLNALGIMFAVKNMPSEAMAYFKEAANKSPDNPSVLNNIGLLYAIQKDYRNAQKELTTASNRASSEQKKQVDLNLALVYGVSGDTQMAKQIAEKYLSGISLSNNLGLYAHLADNDELAKTYLNMALSGSAVYYERAWSNLDIISSKSKSDFAPVRTQKSYKIK